MVAAFAALPATAATVAVVIGTDSTTCDFGGNGCSGNAGLFGHDFGGDWNSAGTTSTVLTGVGSTSAGLSVNAVSAIDGGGDGGHSVVIDIDFQIQIDTDFAADIWTLDVSQSALGLYALRGDGTASAVGTQENGSATLGSINVWLDGNFLGFGVSPGLYSNNPSNNGSASQQFSGSRNDIGIISGVGDATLNGNISIPMSSFTNDGCTSTICSSISGGEEAAVLFGAEDAMDQAVDNYSTWGRSIGPDGYNGTVTLNVTQLPEPATMGLLLLGAAGLVRAGRRR